MFCILKVPFLEIVPVLFCNLCFKKVLLFLPFFVIIRGHPDLEFIYSLFPKIIRQIRDGKPVPFVPVLTGKDKHFVHIAVIEADTVSNDMINIGIPRLKQPRNLQRLPGIRADAVLLLPQFQLDQIHAGRVLPAEFLPDTLHQLVVQSTVLLVFLINIQPFLKILRHLPGQLNVYIKRAFPLPPDDGVHDLDRLGNRPADDRACYLVHLLRNGWQVHAPLPDMGMEIVPGCLTGFVIGTALLQERDNLP